MGGEISTSSVPLKSIDVMFSTDQSWSSYTPTMDTELYQFCSVMINSTAVMTIGGYQTRDLLRNTYFHTFGTNFWTQGPDTLRNRNLAGCGLLIDINDQKSYVVTAGSYDLDSSTEIFGIEDEIWIFGPDLPAPRGGAIMVPFNKSLIMVGGEDFVKPVVKISSIDGPWETMEQTLETPRRVGHVAFLIPDKFTSCN
jgi:hypothetical protein